MERTDTQQHFVAFNLQCEFILEYVLFLLYVAGEDAERRRINAGQEQERRR